jgi:predicted CXXCH cytochrome family protein
MGLAGAAVFTGCAAETRYQALSFLFDGVPAPRESSRDNSHQQKREPSPAHEPKAFVQSGYSQHGPYAARLCEGCHQRGSNRLVRPAEDLCTYCHDITIDRKRLHGPLASGGCTVCHDPHGSRNRYLLVSAPGDFCFYCHQRKEVFGREAHQDRETECTACHDAHGSGNEFLLR